MFDAGSSLSRNAKRHIVQAVAHAAIAAVLLIPQAAAAQGASPFAHLNGSWSGPGVITMSSGTKESIRCRARYEVDGAGNTLTLAIRCAGDAYKFELQSTAQHVNGAVSGHWNELTNRVGGTLSGNGTPGRIRIRAEGPFSAQLAVNTRADKQSVTISSPGSPLSEVSISLSRGR